MAKTTVKLLIDPQKNSLTFNKNFRIFSTVDPITGITEFTDFIEDLIIPSLSTINISNLTRSFRYSRNRLDWSLWYSISPDDLGDAASIFLDKADPFYFEIKYTYDDGTSTPLDGSLQINEIKLRFTQVGKEPLTYSPNLSCSDESCNSIIVNRDPSFRPYEVGSAIGIYQEMSYFTNQLYGHQVVYFRTVPELDSGDYIFKEWTLYKNVDRKCIKVMVPKNAFPSNAPKYTDFGIDFQLPFEIHVDHLYFQSVFGASSEPRKRDFLYFPLLNRMFEIQGSYLHRGFMMSPTFWKVQLKKYNPNIDMLLKDETRHFLDNVILSGEQLFSTEVENDIKDSTMPSQYQTISTTFDSSRSAIHPDVVTRPLKYTYNFASLIENYYDLSKIQLADVNFKITGETTPVATSVNIANLTSLQTNNIQKNNVILAYQGSDLYTSWKNGGVLTNDKNYSGTTTYFTKVRGPFDTIPNNIGQSDSGRYIRLESYRDLTFRAQRDVLLTNISGSDYAKFKIRQTAVVYSAKPRFNTTDSKNLSFTCLFNVPLTADAINFIDGYDNETQLGLRITGQFIRYSSTSLDGDLILTILVNSQIKNYTISDFKMDTWHGIIVSISNEFNQCGAYIYSIEEDPSDIINHNSLRSVFSSISSLTTSNFELDQYYTLPTSNLLITNLRVFNTMVKEEQHEFILSQQFIKDESMLVLIDNCRPQINIPYISKNR